MFNVLKCFFSLKLKSFGKENEQYVKHIYILYALID